MKTGLIGLGAMGSAMAKNLATAGYLTAVYNRTASKAENLAKLLKITACSSPQQLAKQVDLLIICVSADQDVLEMVSAISETIKPESVVVDTSTVSKETAQKAQTELSAKQVTFMDAPVSGGVEGAINGTLSMMVGGDFEILQKITPILQVLSSQIVHMGMVGAGQATKAVNQIMAAGINQAVTEALAFAQAQGLAMDKVIEVTSKGAAGNWFLQHRGPTMTQDIYQPGFKLALHHKDLKICQAMADPVGTALPLTNLTVADYEKLIAQGFAEEDISALYRLKKPD